MLADAPANVYVFPEIVGVPNVGSVVADVDVPDIVAISCVPFCAKDEIVKGMLAVTGEKVAEDRDTFPPDEAVTLSV